MNAISSTINFRKSDKSCFFIKKAVLFFAFLALSPTLFALSEVKTRYGLLHVEPSQEVKILQLDATNINGLDDAESMVSPVYLEIESVFKIKDDDIALISKGEGAISCPMMYQLVKISKNRKIEVTKEFGTCSDKVQATQLKNTVEIKIHNYCAHCSNSSGFSKYFYKNGVLKK